MTTAPRRRPGSGSAAPRDTAPWDLRFLWVGALAAAAATAVAAPVVGVVADWPQALGVLIGAAIVTAFFCLSGVVVAWAGRIADSFTLPAALLTFFVKAVVLYGLLSAMPEGGALDRRTVAWAVVVGALLWSGVQLRWVWTRKLYYVPPPLPPSVQAPSRLPGAPQGAPDQHPEKPATRG